MSRARLVAGGILLAGAVAEASMSAARNERRRATFEAAVKRSVATGRKLVVVGDPRAGLHTRFLPAYDCGELCVDLAGCPLCPESVAADITQPLDLPDDSAVVFVSCVLEYVSDVKAALNNLERVAGSPDNLFTVFVDPLSVTAFLYPGASQRVGDEKGASWHKVTTAQKLIVGGVISALAVATIVKR
ncbi:MAG: hypothetical protein ACPG4T_08215 [Nannocystaceae bacterium]